MFKKIVLLCLASAVLSACQTTNSESQQQAQADIKKQEHLADVNIQLGFAYLEQSDANKAKSKFLEVTHRWPQYAPSWYSLAYFYEASGDKELAEQTYLHAIQLNSKRGDAHNNYGTFLCRNQQYKSSIDQFLLAAKDDEYLETASAYENAGLCASLIPDFKSARTYLLKAYQNDPARAETLMELAQVSYKMHDKAGAKTYLNQYLAVGKPTLASHALKRNLG